MSILIRRFIIHEDCPVCGADFIAYDGERGRPRTYCSKTCRWRSKRMKREGSTDA